MDSRSGGTVSSMARGSGPDHLGATAKVRRRKGLATHARTNSRRDSRTRAARSTPPRSGPGLSPSQAGRGLCLQATRVFAGVEPGPCAAGVQAFSRAGGCGGAPRRTVVQDHAFLAVDFWVVEKVRDARRVEGAAPPDDAVNNVVLHVRKRRRGGIFFKGLGKPLITKCPRPATHWPSRPRAKNRQPAHGSEQAPVGAYLCNQELREVRAVLQGTATWPSAHCILVWSGVGWGAAWPSSPSMAHVPCTPRPWTGAVGRRLGAGRGVCVRHYPSGLAHLIQK